MYRLGITILPVVVGELALWITLRKSQECVNLAPASAANNARYK
jgi:hypothetical protein